MKLLPRVLAALALLYSAGASANSNVYVTRFWHNHQPIYWPDWNQNGSQNQRVQFAWDSIWMKQNLGYNNPENNLVDIFGKDDRRNAYQGGPAGSLGNVGQAGGYAISYSGSLIDNIRNLGNNGQLGYGGNWADGNRTARTWTTPSGGRRLDLVGFTYHHSLGALLPKEVFRKEIQIFKQAWWKAWNGNGDLSDHSKGFFPTEMGFSRHMIDVLADEGYEWVIVASHHLSRTCPTYFEQFDLANGQYGIFSSPPNRADLLGPSPHTGWWYSEPNPGNAAWNVAPFAYQLHRAQYINPDTGAERTMIMVPSDDVLSYRYGYANEGTGKIHSFISPYATDSNRPVIVMPSTDGDNAWGGGSSSWFEATPQLFSESANAGFRITTPQDFVNAHGASAPVAHVEDGAWIFPESDYGSPYFLKWIEPPLKTTTATNLYPGTLVDLETPGFALKFFAWSPIISGANWCETAEQIWKKNGGTVEAWKIQAPYDVDGSYTFPNDIERAWHIYLAGLDSGFNYYGGLGNDDEIKSSLATRRAVELLQGYMSANLADDETPPTVLKPQRFPYNPGAHTFGWFNSIPGGDQRYLKKMPSNFYIWTHAYDVSGIQTLSLKIRIDQDGINPLDSVQNETYAGGPEVGAWVTIPMTRRDLPNTESELNAAANNGQIQYHSWALSPEIADYYFAEITDASLPGFRGKLLDYYVEASDTRGNVSRSDIQHVFVEDDGTSPQPVPARVTWSPGSPTDCPAETLSLRYEPNDGPLSNSVPVYVTFTRDAWASSTNLPMSQVQGGFEASVAVGEGTTALSFAFNDGGGTWDNNGGSNWTVAVRACPVPSAAWIEPANPVGCVPVTVFYDPGTDLLAGEPSLVAHLGVNDFSSVSPLDMTFTNGLWQVVITLQPGVHELNVAFRNAGASVWDNNAGADWNWPVSSCQPPFNPVLCAVPGSPVLNPDPADPAHQNNPGDNLDLDRLGGAAATYFQGGFGSFGRIFVNVDAQALTLGGYDLDPGGDNNVLALFLGADTLSAGHLNLWSLGGAPQALDLLHNVEFSLPMHLAVLLGDEYGDGNYPDFSVGSGYNHGQGIFALGPTSFVPVAGAELSQFDGTNQTPVVTADDDSNRRSSRWEARIPWSALNASGVEDLNHLYIAGLVLSDAVNGVDRYLSGNVLGLSVNSVSELDVYNNFGTAFVRLVPIPVCLPHLDGDDDQLTNLFELRLSNHAGLADPDEDDDKDRQSNLDEQALGTDPGDPESALVVASVLPDPAGLVVRWKTIGGKSYRVEYNESVSMDPGGWSFLADRSESDVADGLPDLEEVVDSAGGSLRTYRVRLLP